MKNKHLFYILFQVSKEPLVKNFQIQLPLLLFCIVSAHQLSADMTFYKLFRELDSALFKRNIFVANFPLLTDSL